MSVRPSTKPRSAVESASKRIPIPGVIGADGDSDSDADADTDTDSDTDTDTDSDWDGDGDGDGDGDADGSRTRLFDEDDEEQAGWKGCACSSTDPAPLWICLLPGLILLRRRD